MNNLSLFLPNKQINVPMQAAKPGFDRQQRSMVNKQAWALAQALAPFIRDALMAGATEQQLYAELADALQGVMEYHHG